jgi:hypothetical protein
MPLADGKEQSWAIPSLKMLPLKMGWEQFYKNFKNSKWFRGNKQRRGHTSIL